VGVFDSTRDGTRNGHLRSRLRRKKKRQDRIAAARSPSLAPRLALRHHGAIPTETAPLCRLMPPLPHCRYGSLLYVVGWRLVVSLSTIFSAMSLHCPPPPNARAGWLSVLSKEEAKRDLGARGLSTYPVGRLLDDGNFGGKSPNRDSGILSLFVNRDDSTRDLEAEGLVPGAGRLRHDGRCTPAARPGQHRGPRANASAFLLSRQGGARVEW
jgi:hypothetical protein